MSIMDRTQCVSNASARAALFGVPFSMLNRDRMLEELRDAITGRTGAVACTANVDFVVKARRDAELREILCCSEWVLCDGKPLEWLSGLFGPGIPERLAGSDMIPWILGLAADQCYSVFILGGREDINRRAVENIRTQYPGIRRVDGFGPPWAPLESMPDDEINHRIREASPDILMVCLGCPKQEKWIVRNRSQWNVGVALGLGACVDFMAGTKSRSPVWMRKHGLEWLYRLIHEPRRLAGRYAVDLLEMTRLTLLELLRFKHTKALACHEAASRRHKRRTGASDSSLLRRGENLLLLLGEEIDADECSRIADAAAQMQCTSLGCLQVDCHGLKRIDSAGLGSLAELWRLCRSAGMDLEIIRAPAWLCSIFRDWKWNEMPGFTIRKNSGYHEASWELTPAPNLPLAESFQHEKEVPCMIR
jgi:exopolysaccharide biosynthesis WecB/TagA/CpsF family protein